MGGDLISRSKALDDIVFQICKDFDCLNREYVEISVKTALNKQPTAYDVEKVIEHLKSASVEIGGVPLVSLFTAKTIVERGGIDDAERD